ncbi:MULTISPECIES: hypothetical protein [Halorussus]|uniref:hypothetical protein n=1 Tax=Halorussus TaxID=1070314 RepID=UPI00209CFF2A|nr:hypothetical protein [Halorussus vallis]USZ74889.1 hypothetical protein NGM07_15795 [Halorussus vallis]
MTSSLVGDALVVVALVAFYGGLSRDLAATATFLDRRLSVGFSLGAYVAVGVAGLLALATVAVEAGAASGDAAGAVTAAGLAALFAVVFAAFFRAGTAVYGVLLRVGLQFS